MQRPAEEKSPEGVDPSSENGKRQRHSPTPAAAGGTDVVSKVMDDDDLLREIILRVGFVTTLVRAALICKRWLRLASDPAFLRCFRSFHPPRLLGFYVDTMLSDIRVPFPLGCPSFVPMRPQPPELAAFLRRVKSYKLKPLNPDYPDRIGSDIYGCQNGRILMRGNFNGTYEHRVQSPLCPESGMPVPSPPPVRYMYGNSDTIVSKESGDGLCYLWLSLEGNVGEQNSTVNVYILQDDVWRMHTSASTHLHPREDPKPLFVGNKIYIPGGTKSDILVLDLSASSFSTIQLPQGVEYGVRDTMFSRTNDDSGLYLINVKEFQLSIWLRRGDNWLLFYTFSLREKCATFGMLERMPEDNNFADIWISHVGDNAEFVFLAKGRCALYLDIKGRALHKVFEEPESDLCLCQIVPFLMIWHPTFPALKGDPASTLVATSSHGNESRWAS